MLGQGIYSLFFDALAHSCNLHYRKHRCVNTKKKENCIKQSADKSKRHLPPRKLIICIKSLTLGAIHPLSDQVNQTFIKLRDF